MSKRIVIPFGLLMRSWNAKTRNMKMKKKKKKKGKKIFAGSS